MNPLKRAYLVICISLAFVLSGCYRIQQEIKRDVRAEDKYEVQTILVNTQSDWLYFKYEKVPLSKIDSVINAQYHEADSIRTIYKHLDAKY